MLIATEESERMKEDVKFEAIAKMLSSDLPTTTKNPMLKLRFNLTEDELNGPLP